MIFLTLVVLKVPVNTTVFDLMLLSKAGSSCMDANPERDGQGEQGGVKLHGDTNGINILDRV